jgi:hypothetical protein
MNEQMKRDVEIAYDEMQFIGREYWDSRDDGVSVIQRLKIYRRYRAAIEVYEGKRDTLRNAWMHARGLRYRPKKYEHDYPVIDHAEIFVDAAGRKAGTLSHTYAERPEIEEFAALHGLRATFLEFSWYAPGVATAVLFNKGAQS